MSAELAAIGFALVRNHPTEVMGDPTGATAATGAAVLEAAMASLVDVCGDYLASQDRAETGASRTASANVAQQ